MNWEKNILLNRIYYINDKIETTWLGLSNDAFKLKRKDLILKTGQISLSHHG